MRVLFFHNGNEAWFGIGYLSSVLKAEKHETDLLLYPPLDLYFNFPFLQKRMEAKLLEQAKAFNPDLIAFSSTTYAYKTVKKMATLLKKELNVPHIIGGIHATALPEHILQSSAFDMVCVGEGEGALLELATRMEKDQDISDIRNLWIKRNGEIIKNPIRDLIQDLDAVPFSDSALFEPYGVLTNHYEITTSRGCPYNCTYCCNHFYRNMYKDRGRYVRRRSVDNVIEELKIAKTKYRFKRVYFWDDVFCRDLHWLEEFSPKYKEGVGLPFHCLSRPETINEKTVRLIKDAGCTHINIGIESGSERIRKEVLNRHMSNQQIVHAAKLIKESGLKINVFNMLGIPGENPEDMWDTLHLNEQVDADGTFAFLLSPFPGTKIQSMAINSGMINDTQSENLKEGIISGLQSQENNMNLNHPYKDLAVGMKTFLPILISSPKWLRPFFKNKIKSSRDGKINKLYFMLYLINADRSRIKHKALEFWKLVFHYLNPFNSYRKRSCESKEAVNKDQFKSSL